MKICDVYVEYCLCANSSSIEQLKVNVIFYAFSNCRFKNVNAMCKQTFIRLRERSNLTSTNIVGCVSEVIKITRTN